MASLNLEHIFCEGILYHAHCFLSNILGLFCVCFCLFCLLGFFFLCVLQSVIQNQYTKTKKTHTKKTSKQKNKANEQKAQTITRAIQIIDI